MSNESITQNEGGLRGGGGCRDLNAVVHYGALQWSRMGGRQSGAVNLA